MRISKPTSVIICWVTIQLTLNHSIFTDAHVGPDYIHSKVIHKLFDQKEIDKDVDKVEPSFNHTGILKSSEEEVKIEFKVNADLLANRVPIITTYAVKILPKNLIDMVRRTNIITGWNPKFKPKPTTEKAKILEAGLESNLTKDELDDAEAAKEEEESKPHKTLMTVVVHTNEEPLVWYHPVDERSTSISRSLCIMDYDAIRMQGKKDNNNYKGVNKTISIVLTIAADIKVKYKVWVKLKDISLPISKKVSRLHVPPDSPAVWRYDHRIAMMEEDPDINETNINEAMKHHRHIRVHVESPNKELCAMVAVQKLRCPFTAQESDVVFRSKWQTMLGRAVIDVDVGGIHSSFGALTDATMDTKPFRHGFFVVALTKSNDQGCYLRNQKPVLINDTELRLFRAKEFHVTLSVVDDGEAVVDGTLITLLFYAVILTIALFLSLICEVPISGTVSVSTNNKWTRPSSILLKIKKCFRKTNVRQRGRGQNRGSINHGLDEAGMEDAAIPGGIIVNEIEMVDGTMEDINSADKIRHQSPTEPSSPLHKASIAVASAAIAETIQLAAQPVSPGKTKKIVPHIDRRFHDVIDAECVFIELSDEAPAEDNEGLDEVDITDGRNPIFGYETATVIDPRLKEHFNDHGACIPMGKRIKAVHYKPNKKAIINRRKTREPNLIDLSSKCNPLAAKFFPNSLKMKSDLYGWMILLVGIFYVLPVSQLMIANQKTARLTGNGDMCFYNFLCKRPLLPYVDDFNHIFSNIAYIFCGIYFIFLTWMRRRRRQNQLLAEYKENVKCNPLDLAGTKKRHVEFLNRRGIPEQYGVFFAMGGALIMEGFLSACYHICPTVESFQFDTTFMYIMAVLIFLKVYQFRHPDITSNAYVVFAFVAFGMIFEAIGYYSHNWIFWTMFIVAYLFLLVVFIIEVYFNGDTREVMGHIWSNIIGKHAKSNDTNKQINNEGETEPSLGKIDKHTQKAKDAFNAAGNIMQNQEALEEVKEELNKGGKGRVLFFFIIFVLNICLAFFILNEASPGVSRYLLLILAANMAVYMTFYACMKYYYVVVEERICESITRTCLIYLFLALLFNLVGLYFFVVETKNTLTSPAISRHKNSDCLFLFYDNHDIWHFASATGLLFVFMALLTLEDNNTSTNWENIPVF